MNRYLKGNFKKNAKGISKRMIKMSIGPRHFLNAKRFKLKISCDKFNRCYDQMFYTNSIYFTYDNCGQIDFIKTVRN